MRNKLSQFGLLVIGVLIGVAVSLNYSAVAQKGATATPLPIEELRAFTEVFGRVKSDYVELVEDKKTRTPYPLKARIGHRVCGIARQRGLLLRPLGNIIVLIPPLSISHDEIMRMVNILSDSIETLPTN